MKKIFCLFVVSVMTCGGAFAATTQWWNQPSICRINNTVCYTSMGAGYDMELWDTSGNCRGMKLICADALTAGGTAPVPMGKTALTRGTGIKTDFDTDVLAGDCFGARKTSANGTLASVNGKYVNVWCNGVLDNVDEIVATGEITFGTQPTCKSLAATGYVGVVNNKCYGKLYAPDKYYIECGAALTPTRLIVLNGAEISSTTSDETPLTQADADKRFSTMLTASQAQRKKYFKTN